jgi:N-methylhydantoinase A
MRCASSAVYRRDWQVESRWTAAEHALGDVADALGLSVPGTAEAVVSAAAAGIAEALKTHAFQRNVDPANAVLIAIGGGGAQHAAEVAELAGIRRVLVMPHAGVMAALGMLCDPDDDDVRLAVNDSLRDALPPQGEGPHALFAPMTTVWVPSRWRRPHDAARGRCRTRSGHRPAHGAAAPGAAGHH